MSQSSFQFAPVNLDSHVLNHRGRTVAIITPQGLVDWLLTDVHKQGPLLSSIRKETHLGYVLGLKFNLFLPDLCEQMDSITFEVLDGGEKAAIYAQSHSKDARFQGRHRAVIAVNSDTGAYEWSLQTQLKCIGESPINVAEIEYNNILPARTGGRILWGREKQYGRTLMVDRDGIAWEFPHQHLLHYTSKIRMLDFTRGGIAGFFSKDLNPVVIVDACPFEPTWDICDAYYDLHCRARTKGPLQPGMTYTWEYRILYLDEARSRNLVNSARRIPITEDDRKAHACPRIAIGHNAFRDPVHIDQPDEAGWFTPELPIKAWDCRGGPEGQGALKITHPSSKETVWRMGGDTQIPFGHRLHITGRVKTDQVDGKGFYLRLRPFVFQWRPIPNIHWGETLESIPVTGTTDGWARIALPEFASTEDYLDCELAIEVILDGRGVAWLSDVDVCLTP